MLHLKVDLEPILSFNCSWVIVQALWSMNPLFPVAIFFWFIDWLGQREIKSSEGGRESRERQLQHMKFFPSQWVPEAWPWILGHRDISADWVHQCQLLKLNPKVLAQWCQQTTCVASVETPGHRSTLHVYQGSDTHLGNFYCSILGHSVGKSLSSALPNSNVITM